MDSGWGGIDSTENSENSIESQDPECSEDCLQWLEPISVTDSLSTGQLVIPVLPPIDHTNAHHASGHVGFYPVHPEQGLQQSMKMFSYTA